MVNNTPMYLFEWENNEKRFFNQVEARKWPLLLLQYLESKIIVEQDVAHDV